MNCFTNKSRKIRGPRFHVSRVCKHSDFPLPQLCVHLTLHGDIRETKPRVGFCKEFTHCEKLRNICPGFRGVLEILEILEIITCKILCEYTSLWGVVLITFSKGIVIPLEGYKPCCGLRMEVKPGSGECQDIRDRWGENPEGTPRRNHWKGLRTRSKYDVTEVGSFFIIFFKKNQF